MRFPNDTRYVLQRQIRIQLQAACKTGLRIHRESGERFRTYWNIVYTYTETILFETVAFAFIES